MWIPVYLINYSIKVVLEVAMKPNEIKSLLILNGIKQSDIAKQLGIKRASVSGAISGQRPSRRIQAAIAKALNKNFKTLWGKAA
jgi:transcriptional regulator with XRE-family HTH domain